MARHTVPGVGDDPASALAIVADAAQETVTERLWQVVSVPANGSLASWQGANSPAYDFTLNGESGSKA
ncbi:hypothetical protein [Streptomyces sp. NPDC002088]|uniref:hypothetical protein n=1 Tax=Streptomyces sp. NPDC002088 TaxID=3154665 RepID=UPI00332D26BC